MEHFNRLSPAEDERLALLAEECAEVVQIVCKIMRHGYDSKHPLRMGFDDPDNRAMLEREVGQVLHAIKRMTDADDLSIIQIRHYERVKEEEVGRYLHHQGE